MLKTIKVETQSENIPLKQRVFRKHSLLVNALIFILASTPPLSTRQYTFILDNNTDLQKCNIHSNYLRDVFRSSKQK